MLQVMSDPIARLKPCLRCRMSLKGHLDDKYCPQCGLSVWLSLNAGDSLGASNPPWLKKTSLACIVLAITHILGVFALGAGFLFPWIKHYLAGGYCLIGAAPMFLLALHEHRHPDRLKSHRLWIRITAGIQIVAGLILLVKRPADPEALAMPIVGLFSNPEILVYAASGAAIWLYLRRLIRRSEKANWARFVSWLLFIPMIAAVKYMPVIGFYLFWMAELLLYVFPFVYFPASVVLLILFATVFDNASVQAAAHWKNETDPAKQAG